MDKPTKTKLNYNEEILKKVASDFECSFDYIRKCIRGDRKGIKADQIVQEYRKLEKAANNAIEKASK